MQKKADILMKIRRENSPDMMAEVKRGSLEKTCGTPQRPFLPQLNGQERKLCKSLQKSKHKCVPAESEHTAIL